jgi:RimJ/RimL family protein N-acetyltransferase
MWESRMLTVRPATVDDAALLFDWRNDPVTRLMSRNSAPVAWEDHIPWLSQRVARGNPGLFIAENDGVAVATYRIDGSEISYTVAPEFRGRGVLAELLKIAVQRHGKLTAVISPRNEASIRAAVRAGLRVVLLDE